MTADRLPLAELLAKAGDGDFLRSVAEAVVQLLMETDVEGLIGAGRHERSGDRTTYRNGYRNRTLDTRLGALQLRIPKLRQDSYFPPFLEPRKTAKKALVSVIQEAWVSPPRPGGWMTWCRRWGWPGSARPPSDAVQRHRRSCRCVPRSSPESSAALAVNCFGWFFERPEQLPPLLGLETAGVPELVDVEFCARFPWSGGRHPWLDAVVQTPRMLIGIESKRFEPFRDAKSVSLSDAYDRPVWGGNMNSYERMRDRLRSGEERFVHLDAAQLVKHAFGLVTEGVRRHRTPALFYLFAEPAARNGHAIVPDDLARHRNEIIRFAEAVAGDEVTFHSASYRAWLGTWRRLDSNVVAHGQAIMESFEP